MVDQEHHPFLADVAQALADAPEARVSIARPAFGSDPDAFAICDFDVDPSCRGLGIGSRLLERIASLADHRGVTLHVEPALTRDGELHLSVAEWYGRAGFVWNDPGNPICDGQMHRRPGLASRPRGPGG
ncbi:GCN5-related N-acetyltransferase [Methylorubrum extorquens DSM 13060]|uniref:GCN5-related N-acetyltransferase n=2 Tax=Methylorubrum extorquens TaxID=408 RepID=H1KFL8_METEX|nr:GCN5-related N-acetyltransferase [Methylorubrum extorquens DSM 13060]